MFTDQNQSIRFDKFIYYFIVQTTVIGILKMHNMFDFEATKNRIIIVISLIHHLVYVCTIDNYIVYVISITISRFLVGRLCDFLNLD